MSILVLVAPLRILSIGIGSFRSRDQFLATSRLCVDFFLFKVNCSSIIKKEHRQRDVKRDEPLKKALYLRLARVHWVAPYMACSAKHNICLYL